MITKQIVFPLATVQIDYTPEPDELVAWEGNLYVLDKKSSHIKMNGNVDVYYNMKKTERTKEVL